MPRSGVSTAMGCSVPDSVESQKERGEISPLSRRGFLQGVGGGVGTLMASGLGVGVGSVVPALTEAEEIGPLGFHQRRLSAFAVRRAAAQTYVRESLPLQQANGDDEHYGDRRASFSKTLPHDDLGEVDPTAYASLLTALDSGDPDDFEAILLSPGAAARLANPQAAYGFEMVGLDAHATRIEPAPTFAGATAAAEMGEVYWQALTRDVPFRDYGSDPLIAAAVADLDAFSATVGPQRGGHVTPDTLFRGETPGDLVGPYISQFLWQPVTFGPVRFEQRYQVPAAGQDFMTGYGEWLALQQGAAPSAALVFDPTLRYIHDNRALGEWVHRDVSFQGYLHAALILLGYGRPALSPTNPYLESANQRNFITFGTVDILHLVTFAARAALEGAWYQKWLVHRRLRPEAYACRLENQLNGSKSYDLHPDVLGSDAVARVFAAHGTRLLPVAFPEGSPTHPSYPAGHATIAGACATILKAFFDEDFVIPDPVEATADGLALDPWTGDELKVGGEINKLAANISLGRDAAGVHYRSDGIQGMAAGEQIAIAILKDYSRIYNERFDGFTLRRFDSQKILIQEGRVLEI